MMRPIVPGRCRLGSPLDRDLLFEALITRRRRGVGASMARGALWAVSKLYAAGMRARNWAFDHGLRTIHDPSRPAISIGNLTAGGTGKTPVTAWLASSLAARGHRPAVLMRGYGARPRQKGDEQRLLEQMLGLSVPVIADPDRAAGACTAIERHPDISCFLLDDGFQHRRLARVFDLVLIDATRPFGLGHLLPRGLLREPATSLGRADAVLMTRADAISPAERETLTAEVRSRTAAPIFACAFELDLDAPPSAVAVSGIGNPAAFEGDLQRRGVQLQATLRFGDHHDYSADDVRRIIKAAGSVPVVMTAKDWVKLGDLWPAEGPAVLVAGQRVKFAQDDQSTLLELVSSAIFLRK